LPFFANGASGIGVLFGVSGGYLVSFPAAAYITGAFAETWMGSSLLDCSGSDGHRLSRYSSSLVGPGWLFYRRRQSERFKSV
jgi:hypothetical protein